MGYYDNTLLLVEQFRRACVFTDPICVCQVERLRKQQQAERENQEAIQTQRMDALKLHYETCIQGEEKAVHPCQ